MRGSPPDGFTQEKIMLFIVDVGFIGVLSVNFSCTKIPSNSSTFLEIP